MTNQRLERESEFHDRAISEQTRAEVSRFYSITGSSKALYRSRVLNECTGKSVLECGCGPGSQAFELVRQGAVVTGIDISEAAIDIARETAGKEGLTCASFRVANVEALDFASGSFDVVCGSGILHHLELRSALREMRRVMRAGGRAIFFEPLGHNLLINIFRSLTPTLRTPDEHPLLNSDLALLREFFGEVNLTYFHLLSLWAFPLRSIPGFKVAVRMLEACDRQLFRFSVFKSQAWIVVIELSEPKSESS